MNNKYECPTEFEKYLREELRKKLFKRLGEQPWWCMVCGEGGNYEGIRPDNYWFPPENHGCKLNRR